MLDKKKKTFEEMTSDERLQAIRKMSDDGLYYIRDNKNIELSPEELAAIENELDKRVNKLNKLQKGLNAISVMSLVVLGAIELIGHSSDNK